MMSKDHLQPAEVPTSRTIASKLRLFAWLLVASSLLAAQPAAGQNCTISANDWGNIQLFRKCLAEGGVDQWIAPDGETVLYRAAGWTDNPTIIVLFLEAGAEPNARADDGLTPLHYGAWNAWGGPTSLDSPRAKLRWIPTGFESPREPSFRES